MDKTLVLFTVAPTGLGHIRVMDALKDGLYPGVVSETIGLQNINASKIHSLGSRIPFLTKITEFYQTNPLAEAIVSKIYINYLKGRKKEIFENLASVASEHSDYKFWVIISTHYALAYSILAVKEEIEKEFGVEIMLCVVVTDDSPQRVWAVKDADIVFVPSQKTKETLIKLGMPEEKLKVISFPVSPRLTQKLSKDEFGKIVEQFNPKSKLAMQIEIPISGAAVQLVYLEKVIQILSPEPLFQFTVVGLSSIYTKSFFERIVKLPHVQVSIGATNEETVELYESIFYQPMRPAIEITKPSEQTFKAILNPNERGGVILLLTDPVGRQEKDNLEFLVRHKLMPDKEQRQRLEGFLLQDKPLSEEEKSFCHYNASHWRAIKLPSNPELTAKFIKRLKEEGIFASMLSYVAEAQPELTSNGVKMIWDEINKTIENFNRQLQ